MKLTENVIVDIVQAYTVDLLPIIKIAEKYGVTRQGVYKALKRNGVSTSNAANGKIPVRCACCGDTRLFPRSRVRRSRYLFCGIECYYAYIEGCQGGKYMNSRQAQRIARGVVSQFFDLQDGHIVHHKDRNTRNNHPSNLMVFATQGDHIRYHRWSRDGVEVEPLWDGSWS